MKTEITYDGIESIHMLVLHDPLTYEWNFVFDDLEIAGKIWEKNFIKKQKLSIRDFAFMDKHPGIISNYTKLVHAYNDLNDSTKDDLCSEWNRINPLVK
jgi:hypothetical protein